ncbi:MAG: dTDP-4-dehydrorhamnose 3,5-epimerase [Parcubacteria group bacterium SW_4_49_11]|nr:MAG: dTDP-4-dehydrorhamnose 3,5-epimerase [Parcubacteria group bacterium SW_4_49_11]
MQDEPGYVSIKQFFDRRGAFIPNPLESRWLQQNLSFSNRGVLRGMHFQIEDYAQAKLVRVLNGSAVDVIMDLRNIEGNRDYLNVYVYQLSHFTNANNINALYVPKGFAHGFLTLEDNTLFEYYVDASYAPEKERSIHWTNLSVFPEIFEQHGLQPEDIIMSDKDQAAITLDEWLARKERVLPF